MNTKLACIVFLSTVLSGLYAQQVKKPAATVDEKGRRIQDQTKSPDAQKNNLSLDIRLMGGIGLPMGSLSTAGLGLGGGGHLDVELKFPFSLGSLQLKAGIMGGYYGLGIASNANKISASVSVIPILGYGALAFPINSTGLTPYLGVGGGGSSISFQPTGAGAKALSSFDGTLGFRLGAGYALPPLPKLSVNLNLNYLIIFEVDNNNKPNNGQIFNVELGVSYKML